MDEVWRELLGRAPDELLAPLKHVVETGQESASDAREALDALVRDEAAMRGLVAAWALDQEATALLLERVALHQGLRGRAEKLRRLLIHLHRKRKADESRDRVTRLSTDSLRDALAHPGLPEGLRAPPGWEVREDGVYRVFEDTETGAPRLDRIAPQPMLVVAQLVDVRSGNVQLRLTWPARRGWTQRTLPREDALDPRGLLKLAAFHAPVSYVNARTLVQFIAEFEAHNLKVLPEGETSAVMGWLPGSPERFLWGDVCIGPTGARDVTLQVDAGARQYAEAWHARGTWEGWLGLVEMCRPYPGLWPVLYGALIPPLLRFLPRLHNFIIDIAGTTSLGKTTALRFAASSWGYPDERSGGIVGSWGSTRVWIESTSALLCDLPLMLDDTKRVRRNEEVARVVYEISAGAGRGRGSPTGMRTTGHWRTVLLSTGEEGVASFTEDGGTRARAICFWGSPLGGESPELAEQAKRIEALADEQYGHLGPRLVQLLIANPALRQQLPQIWEQLLARRAADSGRSGVSQRGVGYLAGLELAAWLMHEHLGVHRPDGDPLALADAASRDGAREADRPAAALASALSWATSQQHRFWPNPISDNGGPELVPPGGWLGTWPAGTDWPWVGFLKDPLKRFLREQGHSPAAVLKRWGERGWLMTRDSRKDLRVHVGGRQDYVVAIRREAANRVFEERLGE